MEDNKEVDNVMSMGEELTLGVMLLGVILFFVYIVYMSWSMVTGVLLHTVEGKMKAEETRQEVVTLNNPVGDEDEMDYVVGTVNSKHKGTDSDTGEESYYLTIDGKVYEVESNIYYSFNKNSDIKYKQ